MREHIKLKTLAPRIADMLYPTRVWLLDIFLVSPITIGIAATVIDTDYLLKTENWTILLMFIGIGMFLSLPTLAVTYLAFWLSINNKFSLRQAEVFCCIVANAGATGTFLILTGFEMPKLAIIYIIATCVSFLIVRLRLNE